jgi:hypothetical protein
MALTLAAANARSKRSRRLRRVSLALFALTGGCVVRAPASAEDLSLLAGVTDTNDHSSGTYAWGLEYRQQLLPHLDASFGYLNEGHLPNNHRDGAMLQLWADTGPWSWYRRLSFSVGAGPYVYFDTRYDINFQGYSNLHGVGLIVTGRARFELSPQWYTVLDISQVAAIAPGTRTITLGVGYSLDSLFASLTDTDQGVSRADTAIAPNEVGVFLGETTLNNLSSNKSNDYGVEYRYRATRHFEVSGSFLEESNGAFNRHGGLTAEAWLVQDFFRQGQLMTGIGAGPYVALSSYDTSDGREGASVVGMVSMTLAWRFTRSLVMRAVWHRGFTGDDQDRDVITLGLALRY